MILEININKKNNNQRGSKLYLELDFILKTLLMQ